VICETCHGTGIEYRRYVVHGVGELAERPCPDCTGGVAHCCDGLREQPLKDRPESDRGAIEREE
jgi:hypothetical protein